MDTPTIVSKKISELIPYARNPRKNDAAVNSVAASIKEFGFKVPIVIDAEGVVVAGHTRLKAAQKLALKTVPCIVAADLSPQQVKAFRLLDNKVAEKAEWDSELLGLELAEIEMDLTPFEVDFEDDLQLTSEDVDLTDAPAPEMEEKAISKRGDLWILGDHRILCGDSTVSLDLSNLFGVTYGGTVPKKAALMNTDPPYGIAYSDAARVAAEKAAGRPQRERKWKDQEIENDEVDGEKLQSFLEACIRAAVPCLVDNAAFYLWHPMLTQGTFFAAAAAAADILIHRQIIWVKPGLLFGFGDYHWRHELCFYGWRRGNRPEFYGERNQTTIWEMGKENDGLHPTQKPVELFVRPILNHTKTGDLVYEPFSGSGSQIIAAERTSRRCYAMEIEPRYVDVAVRRWQSETGREATLQSNGRTFEEITADRSNSEPLKNEEESKARKKTKRAEAGDSARG